MKNLKRALSFALATVMVIGMMVVGAGAAKFDDADKITNTDAVNTMAALNVLNGKGSDFDPEGTLTRAEAAKIVVYALHGGKAPVIGTKFTPTYTDIKDHWAESYIEYCSSVGIIAGRGDGTFDPQGTLTGSAFAKMLLVALGYEATVFGLTGNDWEINTNVEANKIALYDGIEDIDPSVSISRDDAAQMAYNATFAGTMVKGYSYNPGTGSLSNSYNFDTTLTLFSEKFGGESLKGTLADVAMQTAGTNKGTYTITLTGAGAGTYTKITEDYSALLGQEVELLFKDENNNGGYNADEKIYGVYAQYTNAATDLIAQSSFTKTADKKVKADGVTYTMDTAAITLWTVSDEGVVNTGAGAINAATIATSASDDLVRLVDSDNDGDYDVAVVYAVSALAVSYADSTKIIAGANTYKKDSAIVADSLAKDDWAAKSWNFTEGKIELVEIEEQTGKVTATKTNYVKVDGGEWIYNATGMTVDQTYSYYVLNGVVVDKTQTTAVALENLVFVAAVDSGTVNRTARVYYADGTSAVVTVDQTSSGAILPSVGNLYTVTENDYGMKFKALSSYDPDGAGPGTYETADAIFTGYTYDNASAVNATAGKIDQIDSKSIADDAVIFVLAGNGGVETTAKVITGKQLKTLDAHASTTNKILTTGIGSFSKTVNGLTKVTIAAVKWNSATPNTWTNWGISAAAENYGLVTSAPITVASGYKQYTIWNGTENLTVIDKVQTPAKFDLIEYSSIDADGYIKDVTVHTHGNDVFDNANGEYTGAALTGYETNSTTKGYNLTLDGTYVVATDTDTVFWTINSAASTADEIGLADTADIVLADKVAGVYCQNVIVLTSVAGTADVVIFDTTNRLATAAATSFTLTNSTGLTVYDANGNVVVAGTTKLKAGDILTVKNETGSPATVSSVTALIDASTGSAYATGTVAAGATVTLVVDDAATAPSLT